MGKNDVTKRDISFNVLEKDVVNVSLGDDKDFILVFDIPDDFTETGVIKAAQTEYLVARDCNAIKLPRTRNGSLGYKLIGRLSEINEKTITKEHLVEGKNISPGVRKYKDYDLKNGEFPYNHAIESLESKISAAGYIGKSVVSLVGPKKVIDYTTTALLRIEVVL